jgi:hypothetical protein
MSELLSVLVYIVIVSLMVVPMFDDRVARDPKTPYRFAFLAVFLLAMILKGTGRAS